MYKNVVFWIIGFDEDGSPLAHLIRNNPFDLVIDGIVRLPKYESYVLQNNFVEKEGKIPVNYTVENRINVEIDDVILVEHCVAVPDDIGETKRLGFRLNNITKIARHGPTFVENSKDYIDYQYSFYGINVFEEDAECIRQQDKPNEALLLSYWDDGIITEFLGSTGSIFYTSGEDFDTLTGVNPPGPGIWAFVNSKTRGYQTFEGMETDIVGDIVPASDELLERFDYNFEDLLEDVNTRLCYLQLDLFKEKAILDCRSIGELNEYLRELNEYMYMSALQ